MKKLVIFLSLLGILNCAGTSVKYLDPDDFMRESLEYAYSANWTTYIGVSKTRVYLEHGNVITSSGDPKVVIYWTEKGGLPKEFIQKLIADKQKRQKMNEENKNFDIERLLKPCR